MSVDEQDDSTLTTPYQAAGELVGITRLVDEFYFNMDTLPEAEIIRNMHPPDLTESRKKLTYFLCCWLGGPKLFQQRYGPISIPGAHKGFPIGYEERDAWLLCMQRALAVQPYSDELKDYLLAALSIPAERVREVEPHGLTAVVPVESSATPRRSEPAAHSSTASQPWLPA